MTPLEIDGVEMDEFEQELKLGFLEEAADLLREAEQAFLQLESNRDNPDLINQIFRLAHNLKGTSRAVGFGAVAEFTHSWENLILKLKEGEMVANDAIVSLLLECSDHVNAMFAALGENLEATFDSQALIAKLEAAVKGELHSESGSAEASEPAAVDEPSLSDQFFVGDLEEERDTPRVEASVENNETSEVLSEDLPAAPVSKPVLKAVEPLKQSAPPARKKEDEVLRVSLSKIAKINDVVGELVILQTVLNQRRGNYIQDDLSNKSIAQLGKLSKEIQELSMSLRMVPLKSTFQKMTRIVRDTSKALSKQINLILEGEDTEVDKSVLELISDPLVHIIRNSVDHGIEDATKRAAAGKSEMGNVTLRAFHESRYLVIEVKDDGGGIDAKFIRKKCIEKGILKENSTLSDEDIIQFIFHPGFSTKEQVTEVSGRGVGMDVVKTNIEALSGSVGVKTVVGKGSTFRISLPLTMAIIDAMIVRSAEHRFIIPLTQVYESLRPNTNNVHDVTGVGPCLHLRGEVIPMYSLAVALGLQKKTELTGIEKRTCIICRNDEKAFSVEVDEILHQQQVVIKRLGEEIRDQKGLMGSSILGDGKPALIVDLFDLLGSKVTGFRQEMSQEAFSKIAG